MKAAFYLLYIAGHIGFFDVVYFHGRRCRLAERPECQREVLLHTARHLVYGLQFVIVANLRFHGAALLLLALVYAADVVIAWADVWEEKESRAAQGGLPRAEYLMHVVLSVLIGAYLFAVAQTVLPDRHLASAIVVDPPPVPWVLRAQMTVMGVMAFGFFAYDMRRWSRMRSLA